MTEPVPIPSKLVPDHIRNLMIGLVVLTILVVFTIVYDFGLLELRWFIIWNLFLAWLPLFFSFLVLLTSRKKLLWPISAVCLILWLIFFPNAPYMWTDLIHLRLYTFTSGGGFLADPSAWYGLMHLVTVVILGSVFGSLSLYFLHKIVQRHLGKIGGWLFALGTSALSGIGIHIGRFFRFNTWDLFNDPLHIAVSIFGSLSADTYLLYFTFFCLTAVPYLLFYLMVNRQQDTL